MKHTGSGVFFFSVFTNLRKIRQFKLKNLAETLEHLPLKSDCTKTLQFTETVDFLSLFYLFLFLYPTIPRVTNADWITSKQILTIVIHSYP